MSNPSKPSESDGAAAGSKEQPLILVVDDFEDGREMYASYLKFSGYRVDEAADGYEALEKAFALLPDIILMDLSLPGIDGWQATRELKKDKRTANIPIVALTGHALEAHSRSAKEAGCDAFIVKPCMPMDLLNEIRRILDSSAARNKAG
jgi:two-component system cell cycle response regulator DivK